MADPYLGEIRLFAGNYAPRGWATCDGQLMAISQNTALFSILGTTYGGNGVNTFALPDLRGRAPLSSGQGPGLSDYDLGQAGGATQVVLALSESGAHTHAMSASTSQADAKNPAGAVFAAIPPNGQNDRGHRLYKATDTSIVAMLGTAVEPSGASQPHNNMQPFLALTFIIALVGVFPPRP